MLISDSHRFLFVHVQKTGGSTIDRGLSDVLGDVRRIKAAERHAPLGRLLELEPELKGYWTVGFVRNPFARMLSWWRMMDRFRDGAERGVERYVDHLARNKFVRQVVAEHQDFDSFILHATAQYGRLRMPQTAYLSSDTRRADFIGRQETLEQDVRAIYARLDLPWTPPPPVNVDRGRPDYHEVYTDATRRRVEELFDADLRAFDYSF